MSTTITLTPRLYFSYGQFFVHDKAVTRRACDWTDAHSDQGFARRESTVAFGTIVDFGHADVVVHLEAYQPQSEHQRVIAVPFCVLSGTIAVDGPDESDVERSISLPPGNYRLVAAQYATDEDEEVIDLFFEALEEPLDRSAILIADELLNPPTPVLETTKVPGED